jgi:glycerol-3-phosphate dehydrogenase (NAD(P)+)
MTRAVQVTVLGGGSWGTTVAALAARNTPTLLWARDPEVAREVDEQHTNTRYLEDRPLPDGLRASADLAQAAGAADVLVVGVPSHGLRATVEQAAPHVRAWIPALSLAKGLEPGTQLRATQVIAECMPGHPVGLLAGPNLARECSTALRRRRSSRRPTAPWPARCSPCSRRRASACTATRTCSARSWAACSKT